MFASCLPAASESVLKSGPGSYLVIRQLGPENEAVLSLATGSGELT